MRVETIGDATLYLGDCAEILPTLGKVDAVISDPPYGMNWVAISPAQGGANRTGGATSKHTGKSIANDSRPFDPSPWLGFDKVVLWGSNHYGSSLPVGTSLVWIKKAESCWGEFLSDAELAWMRGGHGVFCFRDFSTGQAEARRGLREHPNQKPIALMRWCIQKVGAAETILDPFMGSGTTGVACAQEGRKFIGIEVDEGYFDTACERIQRAYDQGSLFDSYSDAAGKSTFEQLGLDECA